jgi:hypothetical protein
MVIVGVSMKSKRILEKTPNGGDYSEIFYFDKDGKPAEKSKAVKCIIRECKANGELINEIFGTCD